VCFLRQFLYRKETTADSLCAKKHSFADLAFLSVDAFFKKNVKVMFFFDEF
jgi:hypothetical protein